MSSTFVASRTWKLRSLLAITLALPALLFMSSIPADAQSRTVVRFSAGASATHLNGKITGPEYKDYVLGARAGQTLDVVLKPDAAFFNILPPGSNDTAIYIGSMDGNHASVVLPQSGDYTIRVYQMGNAKDTNRKRTFDLSIRID